MDIIFCLILPFILFGMACELLEYMARKQECRFCKTVFYGVMSLGILGLVCATCFVEEHFGEAVAIVAFILMSIYGFWKMWMVGKASGVEDDEGE